jgi:hypothetical protein
MKFASKTYMAQELLAGKRFINKQGDTIYYDVFGLSSKSPFRVSKYDQLATAEPMEGEWDAFNQDIWDEVKPRRVHQDLIDMYEEGQAWQFKKHNLWHNLMTEDGIWDKPEWYAEAEYRLHPHNEVIQAYNRGESIEAYDLGRESWVSLNEPLWDVNTIYRVKPPTKTVYEWMYLDSTIWNVYPSLYTEEGAAEHFGSMVHKKTGRSWEVEV